MWVNGSLEEHGAMAHSLTRREKSMKVSGATTRLTVSASTYIQMELSMKESGAKTCSTE